MLEYHEEPTSKNSKAVQSALDQLERAGQPLPQKLTKGNAGLMGEMKELDLEVFEAKESGPAEALKEALQKAQAFSDQLFIASRHFPRYQGEEEEEKGEGDGEGDDKMLDADDRKCDPRLEKLAEAILCKRDLAVDHFGRFGTNLQRLRTWLGLPSLLTNYTANTCALRIARR